MKKLLKRVPVNQGRHPSQITRNKLKPNGDFNHLEGESGGGGGGG